MISKIIKISSKTVLRYRDVLRLFSLYREELSMKVYIVSIIKLLYKISSMLIMFIPIKIFIVIASGKSISFLDDYQRHFSFDVTLFFLFSSLAIIYLVNLVSQFTIPRFISKEKDKFRGVIEVNYKGDTYPRAFIRRCYGNVVNFLSDFLLVIFCIFTSLYISFNFSIIYLLVLFLFYAIIEYLVLTDNRFDFLNKVGVGAIDFISVCSSLNFLIVFASVFWVYYISSMPVHDGVLLLMLSRLANSGVKGLAVSNYKISQHYKIMDN